MAWKTWVQSLVESYQRLKKWSLMPPCLILRIISYGSRVKWSNLGKGVALSPTLWCSSYRKGSLWVTLNYGRHLYLLTILRLEIDFVLLPARVEGLDTHTHTHTYIYIERESHPKKDCFVASQLFSLARHSRCLKLGSKSG